MIKYLRIKYLRIKFLIFLFSIIRIGNKPLDHLKYLLESEYGHWRGFDRLDTAIPDVYKKITK